MAIDFGFIRQLEGFETDGYVPKDSAGNVLGESGVTIGSGIDLGQWTEKQLDNLGVKKSVLNQVKDYLGKKKTSADKFLQNNPLSLSNEDAEHITTKVKEHFATKVSDWYNDRNLEGNKFEDLPEEIQTTITSVSFQYGIGLNKTPNFRKQILNNDWRGALSNLRNFGDSFSTRRNQEADVFQQGLNKITAELGPTAAPLATPQDLVTELTNFIRQQMAAQAPQSFSTPTPQALSTSVAPASSQAAIEAPRGSDSAVQSLLQLFEEHPELSPDSDPSLEAEERLHAELADLFRV